ncbi:MAG: hypothetical protein AB7E47_00665 [Desulfovibrionaceae bacterium]
MLVLALLPLLALPCRADERRGGATSALCVLAVMPFGVVRDGDTTVDVTRIMRMELEKKGFQIVPDEDLEAFLVEKRIRKAEFLDRASLAAMRATLGVDALLMGFAEAVRDEDDPQVTFSAQLVECRQASVVWANAAACTGSDFATVLGLGKIDAMDELMRRAIGAFLATVPDSVRLPERRDGRIIDMAVHLGTSFARPGDEVAIRVVAASDDVAIGRASITVDGRETDLTCAAGSRCSGVFKAPEREGAYPVALSLADGVGERWRQDGAAILTVHTAPPEISLTSRGVTVSPNGDGTADSLLLVARTRSAIPVKRWLVEIVDHEGRAIRSEDGLGAVPEAFVWRGVDDKSRLVPDGAYRFRLTVEDAAGNKVATPPKPLFVDTAPPRHEVAVEEVRDDMLRLRMRLTDASHVPFWEFVVYGAQDKELRRFEGRGCSENVFDIPLPPQANADDWTYALKAVDVAGNTLRIERERLERPKAESFALEPPEPVRPKNVWVEDF